MMRPIQRRHPWMQLMAACALVSASASAQSEDPPDDASGTEVPTESGPEGEDAPIAEVPTGVAEGADVDEAALEQARDAFRLGSALARQGQWAEARAAFERSEALRPHAVTRYNVGYVERALGHLTRARKLFRSALSESGATALPDDLRKEATAYVAEIERKLARAIVSIDPDTAIAVDGRPLERFDDQAEGARPVFVAGTAPPGTGVVPGVRSFDLLADPGGHVLVLSRAGQADVVLNEVFAAGSTRGLSLETATPEAEEPPPAPAVPADTATTEPVTPDRTWMWVSYGVGAAGIATGSVFGVLALDKKSFLDGEGNCDEGTCPESRQGDIDDMNTFALVSTIGFGVGLAGAAVGTYFLLTTPSEGNDGVTAHAVVTPGSVGVRGRF